MRSPWQRFAVGLLAIAASVCFFAWMTGRPQNHHTVSMARATAALPSSRDVARARLMALVSSSRARMPEDFANVYIGMPVRELRAARPSVLQGRATSDRSQAVWEETAADRTRVVYLVAPDLQVVTQVQYMSRLADGDALLADFRAKQRRYGDPTGFWECPETQDASPTRRITWTGDAASAMEAILVTPGAISATLVVGATEDIRRALRQSHCQAVTADALAHWPVARELRGEEAPFAHPR